MPDLGITPPQSGLRSLSPAGRAEPARSPRSAHPLGVASDQAARHIRSGHLPRLRNFAVAEPISGSLMVTAARLPIPRPCSPIRQSSAGVVGRASTMPATHSRVSNPAPWGPAIEQSAARQRAAENRHRNLHQRLRDRGLPAPGGRSRRWSRISVALAALNPLGERLQRGGLLLGQHDPEFARHIAKPDRRPAGRRAGAAEPWRGFRALGVAVAALSHAPVALARSARGTSGRVPADVPWSRGRVGRAGQLLDDVGHGVAVADDQRRQRPGADPATRRGVSAGRRRSASARAARRAAPRSGGCACSR